MKTYKEIAARLSEIDQEQADLEAIDFEGLFREAFMSGGNADEIEDRQVAVERRLKRLSAERSAMEELAPKVRLDEAKPRIEEIHARAEERREEAKKASQKVLRALSSLESALPELIELQQMSDLNQEQIEIAKEIGYELPKWEMFKRPEIDPNFPTIGNSRSKAVLERLRKLPDWLQVNITKASGGDPFNSVNIDELKPNKSSTAA